MEHKDLKIGLVLGLILVIAAVIKIATDPRLSPKARMLNTQNAAARQESDNPAADFISDVPETKNVPERISYTDLQTNETVPDNSEQFELNTASSQDQGQSEPIDVSRYIQAEKIKTQRFHIVRKDQTLSAISRQYYGTANKWKKIFDANRGVIKDPDKINTGMKLIIPD